MRNQDNLIAKIKVLEAGLRELRIELEEDRTSPREITQGDIKVGDRVRIKNPSIGQPEQGIVHKVNRLTKRITIKARRDDIGRFPQTLLIVRHPKNIELVEQA